MNSLCRQNWRKTVKKFRLLSLIAILTIAVLSVVSTTHAQTTTDTTGWPDTFIYGVFDGGNLGKNLAAVEPLRIRMESELRKLKKNIRVVIYTGSSYSSVIKAMASGRIDAFELGPLPYILATQATGTEALGVHAPDSGNAKVFDPDAITFYLSTIFTKKGNGANIQKPTDLKGKSFSFVDPASASGHLWPAKMIKDAGIDPDNDMKTSYSGSHPSSILSVDTGKVDAGASSPQILFNLKTVGKIDLCYFADNDYFKQRNEKELADLYASCKDGQIVPIAFSKEIPGTPFTVSKTLPDTFKKALKDILTTGLQNDPDWIAKNGYWYVDVSAKLGLKSLDNYYDGLRDVAKTLNIDIKTLVK